MGRLVEGRWTTEWYQPDAKGRFVRGETAFRDRLTADGSSGFPAESGRYHLYVSLACPWAHRVLILRALKRLEAAISDLRRRPLHGRARVDLQRRARLHPRHRERRRDSVAGLRRGARRLHRPGHRPRALGQEDAAPSSTTSRARLSGCSTPSSTRSATPRSRSARRGSAPRSTRPSTRIYTPVNNGVYRAGFATTQQAYDEAVVELFDALDRWEVVLAGQRYLCGDVLTEADCPPLHHAAPLRRRLPRALQVQPAPHRRLPEPRRLPARHLPDARRGRHVRPRRTSSSTTTAATRRINPTRIVPRGPVPRISTHPTSGTGSRHARSASAILIQQHSTEPRASAGGFAKWSLLRAANILLKPAC